MVIANENAIILSGTFNALVDGTERIRYYCTVFWGGYR